MLDLYFGLISAIRGKKNLCALCS